MITIRQVVLAGILQAPPIMLKQAVEWVQSEYAGQLLYECDKRQASDPHNHDRNAMARFSIIREEAEKFAFGGKGVHKRKDFATTQLEYDHRGWEYGDYLDEGPSFLNLRIEFYDNGTMGGQHGPRGIVIYRSIKEGLAGARGAKNLLFEVGRIMRHEMQHFAQHLLKDVIGRPGVGLPHKGPAAEHKDRSLPYGGVEHALRSMEFYPRLSDEIDRFLQAKKDGLFIIWDGRAYIPSNDEVTWKAAVAVWVGAGGPSHEWDRAPAPSSFFLKLKAHNRKLWQRACKLFYEAVASGKTKHSPEELEEAMPPDMW